MDKHSGRTFADAQGESHLGPGQPDTVGEEERGPLPLGQPA
jgi:hypothetical protein